MGDQGRHPLAINTHLSVHDASQIELTLDYPLRNDSTRLIRHQADLFIFARKALKLSSFKDRFYSELNTLIRVHTPCNEETEKETLRQVHEALSTRDSDQSVEQRKKRLKAVKLFGNLINRRLKTMLDLMSEMEKHSLSREEKILENFNKMIRPLKSFRGEIARSIPRPTLQIPLKLQKTAHFVDEYISTRVEAVLSDLIRRSSRMKLTQLPVVLQSALVEEIRYREENKGFFFHKRTTEAEKEYFSYRHGILKKIVSEPLYISSIVSRQDKVYRNMIAMVGASLAAVWANLANLKLMEAHQVKDYGFHFIGIMVLGVVAYVFKDRIKDLSKEYGNTKLKKYLPDFKRILFYQNKTHSFGVINEHLRMITDDSTPDEVNYFRKFHGIRDVDVQLKEDVLHYTRKFTPSSRMKDQIPASIPAIKDILRLNFSDFLKIMDDPSKTLSIYDPDDGAARIETPKVYHMNLFVRLNTEFESDHHQKDRFFEYFHYRLVLNKNGIVRLVNLTPAEGLFYREGEA